MYTYMIVYKQLHEHVIVCVYSILIDAMNQLNTLRKSGDFCDVCLSVRGRHIMGHRVILAGSSQYLYELFSNDTSSIPNNGSSLSGLASQPI